jgi:hypothetical protein
MQFQSAHVSIVRSIRQVSLIRDWQRSRGRNELPNLADFIPDERSGDAADLLINEVTRDEGKLSYVCRSAGERVEQVYGRSMSGRFLHECLDAGMAKAAQPIWDACVGKRLPVYSILPLADPSGCPVTVEQLFLPYSSGTGEVNFVVAALHAWSTEGRFVIQGLLHGLSKVPLHWAVIVDPAAATAPWPAPTAATDEIVFIDQLGRSA